MSLPFRISIFKNSLLFPELTLTQKTPSGLIADNPFASRKGGTCGLGRVQTYCYPGWAEQPTYQYARFATSHERANGGSDASAAWRECPLESRRAPTLKAQEARGSRCRKGEVSGHSSRSGSRADAQPRASAIQDKKGTKGMHVWACGIQEQAAFLGRSTRWMCRRTRMGTIEFGAPFAILCKCKTLPLLLHRDIFSCADKLDVEVGRVAMGDASATYSIRMRDVSERRYTRRHGRAQSGWCRCWKKKVGPDDRPRRVRSLSARSAEVRTSEGRACGCQRVTACGSGDVGGGVGIEVGAAAHPLRIFISSRRRRGAHASDVFNSVPRSGCAQMSRDVSTPRWGTRKCWQTAAAVRYFCETSPDRPGKPNPPTLPTFAGVNCGGRVSRHASNNDVRSEDHTTLSALHEIRTGNYLNPEDFMQNYDTIERDSLGSGPGTFPRRNSAQPSQIILCRCQRKMRRSREVSLVCIDLNSADWGAHNDWMDNIRRRRRHRLYNKIYDSLGKIVVANPTMGRGEFVVRGV
ncbi:hypothetical protein B0H19DRAFT_1084603 [Mycena capillaripes]|nr:hypothetical protein B0H19DRAFT_1084603 [Mycena capillaripes]